MGSQRVCLGSFAWMLERPAAECNRYEADSAGQPTKGTLLPLFLMAAANSASPTSLGLSLLDGGSFIWPEDYLQALHGAERERQTHGEELRHLNQPHETKQAAVLDELETTRIRLADLDEARRAWVATEEYLKTRMKDLDDSLSRLAAQIADMQSSLSWRITAPLRTIQG